MDQKLKILISGDVEGNFKQLFNRVESINKKSGPFEFLFCVGDFFGTNNDELIAYKNGNKNVPVPTYILGPARDSSAKFYDSLTDGEICPNLTYLGKRGLYTLSSGVKVAYLSGVEKTKKDEAGLWNFTKEDVTAVINSCIVSKKSLSDYKGVDLLLTLQWPYAISETKDNGSKLISYLANEIRPRYHFCGLDGKYYEPAPYRNTADNTTQLELATRFISLAKVGNPEKEKYIYALSVTPVEKMRVIDLIQKTTNETKSPYEMIDFKNFHTRQQTSSGGQYFYDLEPRGGGGNSNYRGKRRGQGLDGGQKRPRPVFDQEKCWFCLQSPNVERHLVISIGDCFYLALAKGPINNFHLLIIPITHIQSASMVGSDDWAELEKFKNALKEFFKSQGQSVCFVERNYKTSHLQVNVIAVDIGMEWKIKHSFEDKAEEYNFTFEETPPITAPVHLPSHGAYFCAELPDQTTLVTKQMKHFPLHFVREVFCSENLLNCDEKIDWKECTLSKDEEIQLVTKCRELFKPYDFTV